MAMRLLPCPSGAVVRALGVLAIAALAVSCSGSAGTSTGGDEDATVDVSDPHNSVDASETSGDGRIPDLQSDDRSGDGDPSGDPVAPEDDDILCTGDDDCDEGFCVVLDNDTGVGVCTNFCLGDAECPAGWVCQILAGGNEGRVCLPETFCLDQDGDGYGIGPSCLGPDCDDTDPTRHVNAVSLCDGKDNNCNGLVDDNPVYGFVGEEQVRIGDDCVTGFGGLCDEGRWTCVNGDTACEPRRAPSAVELCNGVDDTCDGLIDQVLDADGNPVPLSRPCYAADDPETEGVGECRAGRQFCVGGEWESACVGQVLPQREVCDGRDNSCSGVVDDDPEDVGRPCTVDGLQGPCAEGVTACEGGALVCVQVVFPASEERCNGRDDLCDGVVDGVAGPDGEAIPVTRPCYTADDPETENRGECRAGVQVCTDGAFPVECVGQVLPQREVCDGRDNSCSGVVDDDPEDVGRPCTVDGLQGPCAEGVTACEGGALVCVQVVFPASEERCNGRDDLCDGVVDGVAGPDGEAIPVTRPCYTGPEGTAGTGICRAGVQACVDGGWQAGCGGQVVPQTETCNGEDQSCDGVVDGTRQGDGTVLPPAGAPTWYRDADGDGFGDPLSPRAACVRPDGYVDNNLDCDDTNRFIHPNASPMCDGVRNNCQPNTEQFNCPSGCTGVYNAATRRGYMFCRGSGRGWESARSICTGRGMDLASVHSAAEHDFTFNTSVNLWSFNGWRQLWIGGQRNPSNLGQFIWSNGAAFDYAGWSSGEPNNVNERCVEMHRDRARVNGTGSGAWNDVGCGSNRDEFICAWVDWPERP